MTEFNVGSFEDNPKFHKPYEIGVGVEIAVRNAKYSSKSHTDLGREPNVKSTECKEGQWKRQIVRRRLCKCYRCVGRTR